MQQENKQLIGDAFHKLTFKKGNLDIPVRGRDENSGISWRSKSAQLEDFKNNSGNQVQLPLWLSHANVN